MFCRSLEEFEVLVDALDDPDRRWFVAQVLHDYVAFGERNYGLPPVPPQLLDRIVEFLGMDYDLRNRTFGSAVQAMLYRASSDYSTVRPVNGIPLVGGDDDEIRQVWTWKGHVFYRESAAIAYREHCRMCEALPRLPDIRGDRRPSRA